MVQPYIQREIQNIRKTVVQREAKRETKTIKQPLIQSYIQKKSNMLNKQ